MGTPAAARTATATIELEAENERLRWLLERQPSCLMRIGRDGTLLAVNAAALGLLGGKTLSDVLGTSVHQLMSGDAAVLWDEFAERVAANGSASLDCDMSDLGGTARSVVLQAVALPLHPDGIESLLVTGRDVTTARRLEESLQMNIARLTREREQLETALEQLKAALTYVAESASRAQAAIAKGEQP